ncbi:hypothetical protein [Mycobacterium sp. SM3041]|uniref:hypothetical protein n=1 Tax=Mycobacterium sp. SM3041 TaxID=3114291 RepID=UPI0032049248
MIALGLLAIAPLSGTGVASAQDALVGKTYAEATKIISSWSGHTVLSTVVGDQVAMDKCLVSSWRKDKKTGKYFLALYCNDSYATGKDAGYSAGSPEGRDAKKREENLKWLHENPEVCAKMKEQHPAWFRVHIPGCEAFSPPL